MAVGPGAPPPWFIPGVDYPAPAQSPVPTPQIPQAPQQVIQPPAPAPTAPSPAPQIGDPARQAAARTARPSVNRLNLLGRPEGYRAEDIARLRNMALGQAGPTTPPGPNPPSNLGPRFQGVRGAGGAGGRIAEQSAAAQARSVAQGNVAAMNRAGSSLPASMFARPAAGGLEAGAGRIGGAAPSAATGGPNPRVGANLMQLMAGQRPPPPGSQILSSKLPGPQVGGMKGMAANALLGGGILATNQSLNQSYDFDSPLGRILNPTMRGAGAATMFGGPTAGMIAGVGSGLTQANIEAERWAEEQGLPAQAGVGLWQSGLQTTPLGNVASIGADLAQGLGMEEPLAEYAQKIEDADIPLVSGVAGWFTDGGPSDEDVAAQQAAQQAEAERMARLQDPQYMDQVLARMNITEDGRAEAMRQYQDSVDRMLVMNEVGQLGVALTEDGRYASQNENGAWVVQGEDGEETVSQDGLQPLNEDQVRTLATQDFYSTLPNLAAMDQQRLQMQNRAATLQSILAQNQAPLDRMYRETADLYSAAGQPALAANQMDQYLAQRQLMQALPMIQAVDQQQALQDQIAQIQLNNQINAALNPDEGGETSEAEQVLEG